MSDQISATERTLQQVFDLWVSPEIGRRAEQGALPDNFTLHMAQVVFDLDKAGPEVRLNDEVKAIASVRVNRAVAKGEAISTADFDEIASIELTDQDPNAGHITIMLHKGAWWITWDTRYNAQRIETILTAADEFLATAKGAADGNRSRAFADNLFSAVELMAKASLMATPDRTLLSAKSHGLIHSRFNLWRKTGNISGDFADLLNELRDMRVPARYSMKDWVIAAEDMKALVERAEAMLQSTRARNARGVIREVRTDNK